jgi:hypothetical protein
MEPEVLHPHPAQARLLALLRKDMELDADEQTKLNQERERILNSGYALTHVRVQKLDALAQRLESMMNNDETFWQKEFRMVDKRAVETVKFSNAVIKEYRETLGDIADELGARTKRQETGSESNTVPISIMEAIEKIYGDSIEI